jgi:cytochrome c
MRKPRPRPAFPDGPASPTFACPVLAHREAARTGRLWMKALPMIDLRLLALAAALLAAPAAQASPELARSKNCVACHHAERRMIGPPFNAIAQRYAGDDTAVATLSGRVLAGTSGAWGQMPMPPQSTLSPEEAEALIRWILSLR